MGAIIRSGGRGLRPSVVARINWNNPLTRGLQAFFDQSRGVELVTGLTPTSSSAGLSIGPNGVGRDFSGTANVQYAHHANFAITGPLTIVAVVDIRSLSNYTPIISKMATNTTLAPYEMRADSGGPAQSSVAITRANANYAEMYTASASIISSSFRGVIVATRPTGNVEDATGNVFTRAGKSGLTLFAGTGTGQVTDNGTSSVWIGRRYDGATQLNGRIYYVALFNRVLADAEAAEIIRRPWQLVGRAPRRIWVPDAVVAGTPFLPKSWVPALGPIFAQ